MKYLISITALILLTGCSTLLPPKTPPPSQPTPLEMDVNKDGNISDSEVVNAMDEYALKLAEHKATTDVQPNPTIIGALELAGSVGDIFFGPLGSMGAALAAALFGVAARTQNRRRKQSDTTARVMVDTMKDAFTTMEGTALGQEGVKKLKDLLQKKQLKAGVYDDISKLLKNL